MEIYGETSKIRAMMTTASETVDAGQHVGQRRLTGTILSDQRVKLAFIDIERHILNCLRDTEGLAKIFYL